MKDGIQLSRDITPKVTFQRYDPQPPVEGVFYQPLKKHRAEVVVREENHGPCH